MTPLLLTTHLVAFFAGGLTVRLLMIRYVRIREVEGHPALEFAGPHHRDERPAMTAPQPRPWVSPRIALALILLVASLVLIGIGVQAKLATEAATGAAADNAARDRADRAYADCLTEFATDLVETIEQRTTANGELEDAERRKDRALDELLVLTLSARNSGATDESQLDPALVQRYEEVLAERVAAQKQYQRVYRDAVQTRKANPYVDPKVVCDR